jgi:glycosyltransferase involved in cell wall biosynthesis
MPLRKICILGFDDYPMLSGGAGYIGGESVQHVLLARAWRDMGLEVSIVLFDRDQSIDIRQDGIRLITSFQPDAGLPGLRFFHPRMSRTLWAMRKADADVYYQSPASPFTGVAAWFARRYRKYSVVRIASDAGCIPGRQLIRLARDRRLYEYGLRNASLIAAQTENQRRLLLQNYGLCSEVINMAAEPVMHEHAAAKDIDVLWVGNFRPVKRPDLALELARRLPTRKFVMIGGPVPQQAEYFAQIRKAAEGIPNLKLLGPLPHGEVGPVFERARLHLNTSDFEGFPNTFLQAWMRAVPVVSFFDPDTLLRTKQLGYAPASMEEMAAALEALLADDVRRTAIGASARKFAMAEFLPAKVASQYIEKIEALAVSEPIPAAATDG